MADEATSLRKSIPDKQALVSRLTEKLKALKLEIAEDAMQLKAVVSAGSEEDGLGLLPSAGMLPPDTARGRDEFRQAVMNTLERRFFIKPSFKIYGGVAGFYDLGDLGCELYSNVLNHWCQHFVRKEKMFQLKCPSVTPEAVLRASGHVDKFTDLMVKDEKTGTCHRADHLLKDFCKDKLEKDLSLPAEEVAELKHILAVLDDLSTEELGAKIKKYGITAPDTRNPLSDPYPFNLMFQTSIGPTGLYAGYMRPETAQGIFVNFKDMYYAKGNKLPFAAAQIGQAFRNEISPRQGLLRQREFTLAEIEHFVDPEDKSHPKFARVADLEFLMFSREGQLEGKSAKKTILGKAVSTGTVNNETLGYFIGRVYLFLKKLGIDKNREDQLAKRSAKKTNLGKEVSTGTVNNETLGYFIGRVYLFLKKLGIDKNRLRFRQHLPNEMAHYAADCWDAEIEISYGWIECVGIADRSAYDLHAHTEKSGVNLAAHEMYQEPRKVEKLVISPSKKEIGLAFKGNQMKVMQALEAMSKAEALKMKAILESKGEVEFQVCTLGKAVIIKKNMVSIREEKKMEHEREFTPSVVEPSFGIGRIMYCIFEHSFYSRPTKDSKQLNVFKFSPLVAPYKCAVFPLVKTQKFDDIARIIEESLTEAGIYNLIDTTGTTIGKRYARTDEIGVPFAITVDDTTTVTIRERDSRKQIRVSIKEVVEVVKELVDGQSTWEDIIWTFPTHAAAAADDE